MEAKNKFVAITIVSVLVGAIISQYIHDKDMDGKIGFQMNLKTQ